VIYTLLLGGLLVLANPLPSLSQDSYVDVRRLPAIGSFPLITLAYPPYILFCIGLSLDALLRPAPSGRLMGDRARQRARPWLIGASLVLVVVSLLVGGIIFWLVQEARQRPAISDLIFSLSSTLSIFDLILAAMLMAAILLLGQAIVSYEIFTGKILPRRGFLVQWRIMVLLTAALSLICALGVTRQPTQIFTILVLLVLTTSSYAMFSWQSFSERDRSIRQLRPFVASQRLFESILTSSTAQQPDIDWIEPFTALCRDVLGASQASLVPLGSLAAFGAAPLHYPVQTNPRLPATPDLIQRFTSPEMAGIALDPTQDEGFRWATPLWSERGLTGILFLGEKRDRSVYSMEEIEIARASGERLADLRASAELSRRLMALQRQRLAQNQVLDHQTRRLLHDEVLPRLHTLMLEMSGQDSRSNIQALGNLHRMISDLLRELPASTAPELARLGLFGAYHQVVEGELQGAFDEVTWRISPEAEERARKIPELQMEIIYYAGREVLRNAARHGRDRRSGAPLEICVNAAWESGLILSIEDDGVGLNGSPSPSSSGQGLTLHSTMMAVIGGSLSVESTPGVSTKVVLRWLNVED
jgi:signal transduction histidine kinase